MYVISDCPARRKVLQGHSILFHSLMNLSVQNKAGAQKKPKKPATLLKQSKKKKRTAHPLLSLLPLGGNADTVMGAGADLGHEV